MCAISSRTRYGTWVEVRSTSRPSSSSQPRVACVSSAACETRLVRYGAADPVGRRRQRRVDVAHLAVQLRDDVAPRLGDARLGALVAVHQGRTRLAAPPRGRRPRAAPRTRRAAAPARARPRAATRRRRPRPAARGTAAPGRARGCRRGRRAADSCRPVEKSVAGESRWVSTASTPGARERRGGVDRHDARVRVRAAQHGEVQRGRVAGDVERVRLAAGDDAAGGGGADRPARVLPAPAGRRCCDAGDRVADRAVAGAAAEVALEQPGGSSSSPSVRSRPATR